MHVYYIIQRLLFIIYMYASACVELLCLVHKKSQDTLLNVKFRRNFLSICVFRILHIQILHKEFQKLYSPYDNQCEKLYTLLDNYNFTSFEK